MRHVFGGLYTNESSMARDLASRCLILNERTWPCSSFSARRGSAPEAPSSAPFHAFQSVIMLFSNPAMAAASGGELSTINGERVVVKFDPNNNSGEVKSVIDGKYLFTLDGRDVSKDDLTNQTKNVNFQDLKAIP